MGNGSVIVIGGGVGPMAGVALHARIIENTLTDGTDQSHLCVHHYSCSELVPDRTAYLLSLASPTGGTSGGAREFSSASDPALGMARVFELAERALDGRPAVGGVPCNTFHAPAIFDRFLARLEQNKTRVRIVDMLLETMELIGFRLGYETGRPGKGEVIGLLSTTGTRRSGVYNDLLAKSGYRILYVSESDQSSLHAAIYDPSWGIKATASPSAQAIDTVAALSTRLVDSGAAAVILACTELPLALAGTVFRGVPLVDPMIALARALIREAAPEKLKPLSK
ncbi:MAG: hypothetical protein A2Y38_26655 [Spirochaetes bacterium GWB1_59_5]|nr:MAG: hypothetical protein A2Y38_26655 [Spirochaetes bacterium GWB1_59_5]